jgi:hypothetical protein
MKSYLLIGVMLLLLLPMTAAVLCATQPSMLTIGHFSAMRPGAPISEGWEPLTFDKINTTTRYRLVETDGRTVIRADSMASASGMTKSLSIDPQDYPWIAWEWKVRNVVSKGDVTQKAGDDFAARIYITFAEDPRRLSLFQRAKISVIKVIYGQVPPTAALIYVWGNQAQVGTLHPSPYTKRAQIFVLESGPTHLDQWRTARRNIVDDYQTAFGTPPPAISGVAIMTDTDNTGASATAWYGDIVFSRNP